MKQLIVPGAIIVALIAIFIVIDRKEFSRHDDVQTVQSESPSTNRKPFVSVPETKPVTEVKSAVETKPVVKTKQVAENKPVVETKPVAEAKSKTDAKPAETNPMAETKPAEAKPVAEPKTVETKPIAEAKPMAEAKPAETKPVAQTMPEENLLPAAVPVVTAEEAEKLNEDALAYALAAKERGEPFFKLYENSKLKSICFQGTIRATSTIPDPEINDYDNCLYALFVEIDALLSEGTTDAEISCEAIVNVPIMKNKTILQDFIFNPGDKVLCTCSEYDVMPQAIQEIQISDDIQAFEHQQYYPIEINKISAFQKDGNRNFAKRTITILPIQALPKDEKAIALRSERIRNEIARIEEEIKKHGGSFEKWQEEYKPIAEKYEQLSSEGYKGWINDSYFSAARHETTYNTKAYINWILPYKEYLQKNNIDLIVLRYPQRSDFAARVLAAEDFQENPAWVKHYYECLKNDIEIVDPMPEMWEKRFDYPLFYFFNSDSNSHPFEGELIVAAEKIASVLARYNYPKNRSFELKKTSLNLSAIYKYPEGHSSFLPGEPIPFDGLAENGKIINILPVNSGSPFVFLSNSFFGYKVMQEQGASVPQYTCFFLQRMVDWKYQAAVRNAMIRNFINTSSNLEKRKAVIMIGNFETWTSGPRIPSYLFSNVSEIVRESVLTFSSPNITRITVDPDIEIREDHGCLAVLKARIPFEFDVAVPTLSSSSYGTCMIRINFDVVAPNISIQAYNKDNKLDETALTHNMESYADLFIPITQLPEDITLKFSGGYSAYTINNIEFWYY